MSAADLTLSDLAHRPIWVGWREEMREGRKTKVPFDPTTGGLAKSDKPTTWSTRGEAEYWAVNERGGVGIMFTLLDNKYIAGIDLDTCRDPATGQIEPRAQEVIDRFASYTEVSPSGTGVKIFFLIPTTELPAIEGLFEGKHGRSFKNGGGEHCPAIEVYRGRRYFTVTDEEISPSSTLREEAQSRASSRQ